METVPFAPRRECRPGADHSVVYVETERIGQLTVVKISRSPVNAITLELATEIALAFKSAIESRAKAIVLTGLDGYFSAGVDLKEVPTYTSEQQASMVTAINQLVAMVYGCPKPVVGAISGHAIAGGLVVALCCDHRVGAEGDFKLGLTEAKAGVPFPAAALEVARKELMPAAARQLVLANRLISPDEALAMGVLDELVPLEWMRERSTEVAQELSKIPPETFARTKAALRGDALTYMRRIIETRADPALHGWLSDETASAAAKLLQKK